MGLVRTPPRSLGWDGLCAARHPAPLGPDPRRAGRVHGPGPSDRGHGRGAAALRRNGPDLADRPASHGHPAGHAGCPGQLRPRRQALRGHRRAVSAPTGQPQGLGRVRRSGSPRAGGGARSAPRAPRTAQLSLDRFLAAPGTPGSAGGPRRSKHHGRRAGRRRTVVGPAVPAVPGHHRPSSARSTTTPPSPSGATATRSPPGLSGATLERPSPPGVLDPGDPRPLGSPPRSPSPGPRRAGAVVRTPEHRAALESAVLSASPRPDPATPRPTGHRGPSPWPRRPDCSGPKDVRSPSTCRAMPIWWR